jgi:hypothetical protein
MIGQWNRPQGEPLPDDLRLDQFTESELDALIDQLRS